MTVQPLISIAMATYNGEKYLKEQLDSIYAQTYKNVEVIVTDDGSTDYTIKILEQYAHSHGLRYFVNKTNLGFVKNFEKAVSLCRGEYIALSDQDDVWLPEKLSTLLQTIDNKSLAFSDATLINENKKIIAQSFAHYSNNKPLEGKPFTRLLISNFVTGCTVLFKRELLNKAHPIPAGIAYHDWWYALIASLEHGISFCNVPLNLYRQHTTNDTGAGDKHTLYTSLHVTPSKDYYKKRKHAAKTHIDMLFACRQIPFLSFDQLKTVDDLITYYQDRTAGVIHVKAFKIALKYRQEIYYKSSTIVSYLQCMRTLLF